MSGCAVSPTVNVCLHPAQVFARCLPPLNAQCSTNYTFRMNHNAGVSEPQGSQPTVVHYYVDRGGPQPTRTYRGVKFKGVEIGAPCLACPIMFGIFFLISATITLSAGGPKALGVIFLILGIVLALTAGTLIVLFCMQNKRSGAQAPSNYGTVAQTPPQPNTYPGQPGVYPGQPGVNPGQPGVNPGQPTGYPGQATGYPGQPANYPGQPTGYPGQPAGYSAQPAGYTVQPAGFDDQPPPYSVQPAANPGQYADPPAVYPSQPGGYPAQADQSSAYPTKPGQMAVRYEFTPPAGQGAPPPAAPSVGSPAGPSAPPEAPGLDPYKP